MLLRVRLEDRARHHRHEGRRHPVATRVRDEDAEAIGRERDHVRELASGRNRRLDLAAVDVDDEQ